MTVRIEKPAFNIREKLSELDYGHVPYEKMPAGSVIQHKYITRSNDVSISTLNVDVNIDELYFTPRFSNSLLELGINYSMGSRAGQDARLFFYVYDKNGTNGVEIERTGNLIGIDAQGNDAFPFRQHWVHYYEPQSIETKLYKFIGRNITGTDIYYFHTYGSATTSTFWIKEIKR